MKKYIPYITSAVIISTLVSLLSYMLSEGAVSGTMMLIISVIGTMMVATIICLIGRILEDKNTLLVKAENTNKEKENKRTD